MTNNVHMYAMDDPQINLRYDCPAHDQCVMLAIRTSNCTEAVLQFKDRAALLAFYNLVGIAVGEIKV